MSSPWIVCAAMLVTFRVDGEEFDKIICSPRHYDRCVHGILDVMDLEHRQNRIVEVQGFVDQYGKFLTREEAWLIAKENNQIIRRCGNDEYYKDEVLIGRLFSENLY